MLDKMDTHFGPADVGRFDFTIWFEHTMLGLVPTGIIVLALPAVIATLKLALAILEEMPKRNLLYSDKIRDNAGTEGFSGFWNRSMLIWVTRLVVKGSHQHLKVEDLPPIGQQDNPEQLYNRFTPFWDTLAAATISKWPLIRAGSQTNGLIGATILIFWWLGDLKSNFRATPISSKDLRPSLFPDLDTHYQVASVATYYTSK
ncbi:hypothetical protein ACQRIT_001997 [Beauveria bassiana]